MAEISLSDISPVAVSLLLLFIIFWFLGPLRSKSENYKQKCVDENPDCPKLASEGECKSNPVRMLWGCQKSCNTCHLSNSQKNEKRDENLSLCKDFRPNCSRMGVMECNEPSIRLRCRKTCKTCKT